MIKNDENICLDKVNGSTTDYARGMHKVKYSYAIELPKFGKSGFEPRPSNIVEVGLETYAGISAMVKHVYNYYACKRMDQSISKHILTTENNSVTNAESSS